MAFVGFRRTSHRDVVSTLASLLAQQFQFFSVLRYRDFRLYWFGLVAQVTGQQMMQVTMGWLAFDLTGSPLALGIVNLLQAAPRITFTLLGGVLADRMDQRLLIAFSQGTSALILVGLAVLTIMGRVEVWHLGLAAFLVGLVQSFDEPSRQSLFPRLLPDRSLIAIAVPLNSMAWQVNRIVAPSVAGFAIAAAGASAGFFIAAAGSALMAMVVQVVRLNRAPQVSSDNMLRSLTEGVRYVWVNPVFRVVIGMAFFNSIFAMGYMFMMPVFAADILGVDAKGLGLLYSAGGVGAIIAVSTVSLLVRRLPPVVVIFGGLLATDALIAAFALSRSFPLSLAILVLVGYGSMLYLTGGEIVLQTLVPDGLRGRTMGLYGMLWSLVSLGGALLNAVANFAGVTQTLVGGTSLVMLVCIVVVLRSPAMRRLRLGTTMLPGRSPGPT